MTIGPIVVAGDKVMLAEKELEIKLEGAPSAMRRLNGIPLIKALNKPPKRVTEVSVYFDTDKHKLRKNGLMLRVRRIGKRHVQTIKAAGNSAPIERDEWETQISGTRPDLRKIGGTPLESLMSNNVRLQLKPMFETRVHRTIYPLADDARSIELTIDRGKIDTGDGSMPLCELELELKRGNKEQLFQIARAITHALPVRLALKSKSERGYQLISGQQDAPVKTAPVDLPADSNARDDFKVICFACLKQVIDNVAALVKEDPEGVHQMRVGLRRLRAAMSLFSDLLGDDQTAAIETELTWLAGALAPAREFEFLMERVIAPIKKQHGRLPSGVRLLSQELAEKRKAALTTTMNAVTSARFRVLILEVAAWLELGHWIKPQDDLVRSRGDMPIEIFATEQLQRRWRKVRKTGKELAQLDAKRRHKLRIQVKKLRYTAEFFGELFHGKKAIKRQRKFTTALERLQDGLGDLNDITVDEHLIAAAETGRRRSSLNSAFADGRGDVGRDAGLREVGESQALLAINHHPNSLFSRNRAADLDERRDVYGPVSLMTDRTVRSDTAMTGEISLRGLVLPVGGIKEKVIAAARAGLKRVMLPARNRKDYEDIPQEVRDQLEFIWLERVEEAASASLETTSHDSFAPGSGQQARVNAAEVCSIYLG